MDKELQTLVNEDTIEEMTENATDIIIENEE